MIFNDLTKKNHITNKQLLFDYPVYVIKMCLPVDQIDAFEDRLIFNINDDECYNFRHYYAGDKIIIDGFACDDIELVYRLTTVLLDIIHEEFDGVYHKNFLGIRYFTRRTSFQILDLFSSESRSLCNEVNSINQSIVCEFLTSCNVPISIRHDSIVLKTPDDVERFFENVKHKLSATI